VEFEWDEEKRYSNLKKHGIDFQRAKEIWNGPTLEIVCARYQPGESRNAAIGQIGGRFFIVIYTWRGPRRRIISARPAARKEREHYAHALRRIFRTGLD
jgi:uncharacterized DUF497 family protein